MVNNFKSPAWTEKELDTVKRLAPTCSTKTQAIEKLLDALPNRTRDAIRKKIDSLNVNPEKLRTETYSIPPTAYPLILKLHTELGISPETIIELFKAPALAAVFEQRPEEAKVDPQQEKLAKRVEFVRRVRAKETTFEEVALELGTTLDNVVDVLTPFFQEELDDLNKFIKHYNSFNKTALTPVDKISTNIVVASIERANKDSVINGVGRFIELAIFGKWPDNG